MFLGREKRFLQSLKKDVDLNDWFPEEIIEFLKEKERIHQIKPKVLTYYHSLSLKSLRLLFGRLEALVKIKYNLQNWLFLIVISKSLS